MITFSIFYHNSSLILSFYLLIKSRCQPLALFIILCNGLQNHLEHEVNGQESTTYSLDIRSCEHEVDATTSYLVGEQEEVSDETETI